MSKVWVADSPNTILFFDEVTSDSVRTLIEKIRERWSKTKNEAPVQVLVNSTGGDAKAAFAFLYTIGDLGIPIHTFGYSIESAAVLIYLAGETRFAHKTRTQFLLHEAKVGLHGEHSADSAKKLFEELEGINSTFAQCVAERTGTELQSIVELMAKGTWLNAQQAKELNLVNAII